ncbi:MAG TPA: ABC transporter permease [Gemmatimonadales bacterium]
MRKVLAVVRREFTTRVHTRAFVVGTVLGPLLMGFMFVLPILLSRRETAPKQIVVLDAAPGDFGRVTAERLRTEMRDTVARTRPRYRVTHLAVDPGSLERVRDSLVTLTGRTEAGAPSIDGILVLDDTTLVSGRIRYLGVNVGSPADMGALRRALDPLVKSARLTASGVDPVVVMHALRPIDFETLKVSEGRITGESGEASFLLAYVMSFMLYFALLLYGIQVMSSVVEEKSSRIMEVLVSSLSPFQMLLGKVIGVGAVALLQLAIWAGTAMVLTTFGGRIAGLMGASPAAVADLPLPAVSPDMLAVFLTFFSLGFLFFSALYAAIGSMCSTVQETQQSHTPVTILIAAGLITMFGLLSEPAGTLARTLSLVPFLAPFVTPVRYSFAPLPWTELLASATAMVLGILAVIWVAARIYRVGILSYGKKATLREVVRWVREG